MYNEEAVAKECYKRITSVLLELTNYDYEIVIVDDGSKDKTLEIVEEIAQDDKKLRVISFSRNFGHQAAVTAGLKETTGDAVVIIDADMITLMDRLNIPESRMIQYGTMSVEDIVEAEAEAGNTQAIEFATELFTSVEKLVKIFKLSDPNNKLEILSEMTSDQLAMFLPEMEESDLTEGLKYFTQDKLLKMLESIPAEQLVNTVMEMFSEEEIIEYLPEEQLNKLLTGTDVDKNKILEQLKGIQPAYIMQMLENVTGKPVQDTNQMAMIDQLDDLNPLDFKNAVLSMQSIAKKEVTLGLTKHDNDLYQQFDAHAYTKMINKYKHQPEVVKAMDVIEPDEKIKMLKELPNDLLSIVITQIDARDFAYLLINRCPDILAQIVAR